MNPRRRGALRRWILVVLLLTVFVPSGYWLREYWRRETIATVSRECRDLKSKSEWNELARVAERWTRIEPENGDPWLFRAQAAEGLNDWANAVAFLDRVPRSDRRAISVLVSKATAEFERLNRPLDGVKTCDEILKMDPRVLIAHKQVIFFDAMTLQRADLVRRVRQAIHVRRESPESYVYLVSASWLYSGSLYHNNTHWLEGDPNNEMYLIARALQVYTSNAKSNPERAAEFEDIPEAEDLLQQYPHNLELVAYFLNRSITEGNVERVRELLDQVADPIADADARFWRARAWCDDTDGDLESAEKSLQHAFALDPYWWQIHFQLHDVLRRLGRMDESAKYLAIYKASKELSTMIMSLNNSIESLDEQLFCRQLLDLAQQVGDDDVTVVLRDRMSQL